MHEELKLGMVLSYPLCVNVPNAAAARVATIIKAGDHQPSPWVTVPGRLDRTLVPHLEMHCLVN